MIPEIILTIIQVWENLKDCGTISWKGTLVRILGVVGARGSHGRPIIAVGLMVEGGVA